MAFLSDKQLEDMGFANLGVDVFISDKASIYNPSKISIGSHVRIDDFAVISAGEEGIEIGNYIHIACFSCMVGHSKITLQDFSGISIRATVLSSTSDFSGEFLPRFEQFHKVNAIEGLTTSISKPVTLEKYTALGSNSIIMPGCTIGEGSYIGAMSFVHKDVPPGGFYWGNPARFVKKMSTAAVDKLEKYLETTPLF